MVFPDPSQPLPTMYDLPSEDPNEPGLPDLFHLLQPELLRQTCRSPLWPAEQVLMAADLNLYYDPNNLRWYKRPDWFIVVGVDRLYEGYDLRLSYVIWIEQVPPLLVVELLSPGTEKEDLGQNLRRADAPPTKWEVYERILKIPYYAVYDRYRDHLRIFHLEPDRYQQIEVGEAGLWIPELGLRLIQWMGAYQGATRQWLRWETEQGDLILTPEEELQQEQQRAEQARQRAEQERQRAEQERQRAEQERQRADHLAEILRQMNVEIEDPFE